MSRLVGVMTFIAFMQFGQFAALGLIYLAIMSKAKS
jgi:hypothetical protein